MASYTSNLNLKKPALTDDALVTDLNDNSDKLDAAISAGSGAIAIVSVGNTHAAISSGQYVYVRQHGSLSEGLYNASTNIAANGTLSSSNLTAVSKGGLNALSDHITNETDISSHFTAGSQMQNFVAKLKNDIVTIIFTTKKFETANTSLPLFTAVDSEYRPNIQAGRQVNGCLAQASDNDFGYGTCHLNSNGISSVTYSKTTNYGIYGYFIYQI